MVASLSDYSVIGGHGVRILYPLWYQQLYGPVFHGGRRGPEHHC